MIILFTMSRGRQKIQTTSKSRKPDVVFNRFAKEIPTTYFVHYEPRLLENHDGKLSNKYHIANALDADLEDDPKQVRFVKYIFIAWFLTLFFL